MPLLSRLGMALAKLGSLNLADRMQGSANRLLTESWKRRSVDPEKCLTKGVMALAEMLNNTLAVLSDGQALDLQVFILTICHGRETYCVNLASVVMCIATYVARRLALSETRAQLAEVAPRKHPREARAQAELKRIARAQSELKKNAHMVTIHKFQISGVNEIRAMAALKVVEEQHKHDTQCASLPLQCLKERIRQVMGEVTTSRQCASLPVIYLKKRILEVMRKVTAARQGERTQQAMRGIWVGSFQLCS